MGYASKNFCFWMQCEVLDRFGVQGLYELHCPESEIGKDEQGAKNKSSKMVSPDMLL